MTGWAQRRFWTSVSVGPAEGGFSVALDGRPVRTPQKLPLILPTTALAQEIAAEWQAVVGVVDPTLMPFTRTANSAIDKVTPQFAAVAAMLAAYGESDLVCYRAEAPDDLAKRQAKGWDPVLLWADQAMGAKLATTLGVIPVAQPEASIAALAGEVHGLTPFQLAAFHDLVAISGSLVLALAVVRHRLAAEEAWLLSRIDEDWQVALWGADEEAAQSAANKRIAFLQANRFFSLCG